MLKDGIRVIFISLLLSILGIVVVFVGKAYTGESEKVSTHGIDGYIEDGPTERRGINLNKKILIDIGHGGEDKGTKNSKYSADVLEKDINLEIGLKLINKLGRVEGIDVLTTRIDDSFVSLSERAKLGNTNSVDMFVSIHCNATEDGGAYASGIETFYRDDNSEEFARHIQDNLISALQVKDRGTKYGDYQVLRESESTAILIECGFLTNPEERLNLGSDVYQDIIVDAIVKGVVSYYSLDVSENVEN